jgi:Fe-S cluster assembly iron-binding protein IscA
MALDEPKDDDAIVENNGIKFVMDTQTTDILRQSGGLTIDYVDESGRRGYMLKLGAPGQSEDDCSSGGCNGCG